MEQFELKSKFTGAFFNEFQFDAEFRSIFEAMTRGLTPYEAIEHLCKSKKELFKSLQKAIENTQTEIIVTTERFEQLNETSVSSCYPSHRQIFFVLFNEENRDFFKSITEIHIFTTPLIMDSRRFINSELAEKFMDENKLKGFKVCRITRNILLNNC